MEKKRDPVTYGRIDYSRVANRILFHREATRQTIASETGLSLSAVTKYTKWLKQYRLIQIQPLAVEHAKKPIDLLTLHPDALSCLVISLGTDFVFGELIGTDLKPKFHYRVNLTEVNQSTLLAAFRDVMLYALRFAKDSELSYNAVGLSVAGCVDSLDGIIYSVRGVEKWEPCQPWEIFAELHESPKVNVWTRAACKLSGVCMELKTDHRVAFVECDEEHVSLAAMHGGEIRFGSHGTASHLLHTTISDDPAVCFCGRSGCFYHHLNSGKINSDQVMRGLNKVMDALPEDYIVLQSPPAGLRAESDIGNDSAKVRFIENADKYHAAGLRALTARVALTQRIDEISSQHQVAVAKASQAAA